jgi:hypothetical protein
MMYELVVGEPPFVADGAGEVIALQLFGEVEPPRNRVPDLSPAYEALVLKLLEKDPAARPGSAAQVVEELGRVLPGLSARLSAVLPASPRATSSRPVITPAPRPARAMTPPPRPTTLGTSTGESIPPSWREVEPAAPRRSRAGLWIVLAAVVAAAGIAVVAFGLGGDGKGAPATAPAPAPAIEGPAEPAEPGDIQVSLILDPQDAAITVDGKQVDAPGGILRLPRDGEVHRIEVSAPGYVTRSVPIRADRDQSASIALASAPAAVTAPATEKVGKPDKRDKRDKRDRRKRDRRDGKPGDGSQGGGPIEESL